MLWSLPAEQGAKPLSLDGLRAQQVNTRVFGGSVSYILWVMGTLGQWHFISRSSLGAELGPGPEKHVRTVW